MSYCTFGYTYSTFYTNTDLIGVIYSNYDNDTGKLSVAIKQFDQSYHQNNENEIVALGNIDILNNNIPIIKSRSNGMFDIAQLHNPNFMYGKHAKNYQYDVIEYNDQLANYIDIFDTAIKLYRCETIANNITVAQTYTFAPYVDVGFIPIHVGANSEISSTTLTNDLIQSIY